MPSEIPEIQQVLDRLSEKTYYRIGEVASITRVKAHVLRFWESEFNVISPPKSRSKQRMYRKKDIETILLIKHLLYQEGFTIKGARKRLAERARAECETAERDVAEGLREVLGELEELRELIGG